MRILFALFSLSLLVACADKPGSEPWCIAKKEQAKSEWSGKDAKTFAKHCLLDSQTIGSEDWCKNLEETPKGDWSATEAGDYAKHCVIK